MPCYDSRQEADFENSKNDIDRLTNNVGWLEAALCAVSNELTRRGIAEDVFACASRDGLIDLMDFLARHRKDDVARLANDIHQRYSKDELEVIRGLLKVKP